MVVQIKDLSQLKAVKVGIPEHLHAISMDFNGVRIVIPIKEPLILMFDAEQPIGFIGSEDIEKNKGRAEAINDWKKRICEKLGI